MDKNVTTFIGCDKEYDKSKIVIFGAPFDSTTSFRPGTRFASSTMRTESFGLETYSPYQDKDLEDIYVFDAGDLELCFGDTERALSQIEEMAAKILMDGKIPCMIGGEHLVTLGAVRAMFCKYPDLRVVHFDAHTDLREEYLGASLSHASVMRRVWDMLGDGRIYQFGIRSGERSEFAWAKKHVVMNKFNFDTLPQAVEELAGHPVYISLDLDVLDPSIFPGTGTPEAGGVSFSELLSAFWKLAGLRVVGFDINELSPVYDQSGVSTAVACKVLRELLLLFYS
jgi:agmatinase